MSKRMVVLICSIFLIVPLLFMGCGSDGSDGAKGAAGATGTTGATGPPGSGVVADETCALCHASGKTEAVAGVHRIGQTAGSINVAITSVEFGDTTVDNTVPVTVNFTFAATNSAGASITDTALADPPAAATINLGTLATTGSSAGNLAYLQFSLAKLVPGVSGDADRWEGFIVRPTATGSGPYYAFAPGGLVRNGAGDYSYTFPDNAVRLADTGAFDNLVVRAAFKASGIPIAKFTADPYFDTSLRRPVGTAVLNVVKPVGAGTGTAPPAGTVKNDVSTAACNACHDPLGIHGGSRREVKLCVVCHNAKLETVAGGGWDNGNLVNLVHKIHTSQNIGALGDFSTVGYPQAPNNCTTCHQGPDADNTYNNWKDVPTIEACGACHTNVNFATGAGHLGGARTNNAGCAGCHDAAAIPLYHAAKEGAPPTPNNPLLAGTLKSVVYGITSATVDNTNAATVKFSIKIDNVVANLGAAGDNVTRPAGFSGGPSFLFSYTLPQDGISAPADYNNIGKVAGQPQSVSIVGLPITAFDNASYTVKVAGAFPAGAKMRAVALQGYFTQTSGGTSAGGTALDNVARHTVAVMVPVTGDTVRRTVVKSGYNATTGKPEGCLECHEVFEGHGGNRVNNAQVCVMCHNPSLTSSGRTITASPINPAITALFGTDPLAFPEVPNNFKELIHGLHAREMRVNEFVDIRNRLDGVLVRGEEVTYPGDLSHCTKCHVGTTYQNVQVTNGLLTTAKITTGVAGETLAQINAARASVPNATDLVNTPTASACGYCHDTPAAVSHFVTMGGEIKAPRGAASMTPPALEPVLP